MVALCAAIGAAAGSGLAQLRPRQYRAQALVLVGPPGTVERSGGDMETFAGIVCSRSVAERAARKLLGKDLLKDQADPTSYVQGHIRARIESGSRLLGIEGVAPDAALASELADAVAEAFVTELMELARRATLEAKALFPAGEGQLQEKLRAAEEELLRFQEENGIVPSEDALAAFRQRELVLLEEFSRAQARRLALEAKVKELSGAQGQSRPSLIRLAAGEDARTRQLMDERLRASARVLELSANFSEGHKELEAAKSKLNLVERELAEAVDAFAKGLSGELEAALWKERELSKLLEEHRAQAAQTRCKLARYDALLKRRDTLRALAAPPSTQTFHGATIVDRARAAQRRTATPIYALAGAFLGGAIGMVVSFRRPSSSG